MEPEQNLYYNLPSSDPKLWALISEKLSLPIPDIKSLTQTINFFANILFPKMRLHDELESLTKAINEISSSYPNFKFFEDLLPKMQKSCLEAPLLFPAAKISILPQKQNSQVKFTGNQIRCLLCLAFFDTLNSYKAQNLSHGSKSSFGNITFYQLYGRPHQESRERLKCLLFYFFSVFSEEFNDEVIFIRKVLDKHFNWKDDMTPISKEIVISDEKKIEDSNAFLHVDFANKNLQIHQNIPSCTQEEVLFSIRPALYITLLLAETMKKNEAIFMLGCRRFCNYKGYLETFEFNGGYEEMKDGEKISGIIAIDSVVNWGNSQFKPVEIDRDLNKAYLGFCGIEQYLNEYFKTRKFSLDTTKISTGNWGCGAFGGDVVLKFVQQIMVANVTGKNMEYSTFGNHATCLKLRELDKKTKESKVLVRDLYGILMDFWEKSDGGVTFEKYLNYRLAPLCAIEEEKP